MDSQDEHWLLQEKYNGEKTEGFFADLERFRSGEPLAFIIGSIPFLHTTIFLDSHPLIPRVETEYWVSQAIETIKHGAYEGRPFVSVLDLCAGSGCIGVAVAQALPTSIVHFAEIDEKHHATILRNIKANEVEESRTEIFGGNLFEHINGEYDVILCNPPYIRNGSEHVQESVKKFEPAIALYGGEDGTDLIAQIIAEAPSHLSAHGVLFLEHEPEQVEQLITIAKHHGFSITTHNDQYNTPRYSELRMAQ